MPFAHCRPILDIVAMRPHCRILFIVTVLAALGAQLAAGHTQGALQQATLRLDWLPSGQQVPFYLAKARGYYANAGIDLQILDGKGSASTVQAIASNSDTFGFASLDTAALLASKGAAIVAVMGITQKSPNAVLALAGTGIRRPQDLIGKQVALVPDGAAAKLFPSLLKANNIGQDSVKIVQVGYATLYSTLLQNNADAIVAFDIDGIKVEQKHPIEPPMLYADYGLNSLGAGVIVNKKIFSENPELVRKFLVATVKGVADTVKDPEAATKALVEIRPEADSGTILSGAKLTESHLYTKDSEGHPIGWIARQDWDETAEVLKTSFGASASADFSSFYTNDYLPKQ
jgi:NitT/TauT family transport system substrate-binding protein